MADDQPQQPSRKSEDKPPSQDLSPVVPVQKRRLGAGEAYRAARDEDFKKRGQTAIDEDTAMRKRMAETSAKYRAQLPDIRDIIRMTQPPELPMIASTSYVDMMRTAEAEKEEQERRWKKAAKKVDELVLWAYRDRSRRTKPFDGYAWWKEDDRTIFTPWDDVIRQAVLDRHFNFVGDRFKADPDELSVEEADHRTIATRRGRENTCEIVFTPAGLKHGKALYRKAVSWLRFVPVTITKTMFFGALSLIATIAAVLGNLEKISPWSKWLWQAAHHATTQQH